jgi:hypothetical protein
LEKLIDSLRLKAWGFLFFLKKEKLVEISTSFFSSENSHFFVGKISNFIAKKKWNLKVEF